jgi:hypothetical protein
MFEIQGNNIQISLPDLTTFFAMVKAVPWYYWPVISGAYGYLTHLKALPGYYKYKKEMGNTVHASPSIEWICLGRILFSLPFRVLSGVAGVLYSTVSLVSSGNPKLRNQPMRWAWHWHLTPDEFFTKTGKEA